MLFVGVSVLNFIAIRFHKLEVLDAFYGEAAMHLRMMKSRGDYSPPPYIKVSEKPLKGKDLVLFDPSFNGKFVFLDMALVNRKLRNFALSLFLWEAFLVLSLSYIFYKLLWYHLHQRERNREFLELVLLAFSHKLGNFLSTQRLNIEILKQTSSSSAVKRLEEGYHFMESQFKRTMDLISGFRAGEMRREEVDLKGTVKGVLGQLSEGLQGKELELELKEARVQAFRSDLEMIVYLLVENAVKYSRKKVKISLGKDQREVVLHIENDIDPEVRPGSGVGLDLVRRLGEKYRMKLRYEEEAGRFALSCRFPLKRGLRIMS